MRLLVAAVCVLAFVVLANDATVTTAANAGTAPSAHPFVLAGVILSDG
jgi:hypothetical protein